MESSFGFSFRKNRHSLKFYPLENIETHIFPIILLSLAIKPQYRSYVA